MFKMHRRVIVLFLLSALSACSGGAGGSGDTPTFGITYSTSVVSITAVQGSSPAATAVVINATGNGPAPGSLYIGATQSGVGILTPIQVVINQAAQTGTITVMPNTALSAGTYSGSLTLLACGDSNCGTQYRGSPFQVSYTVTILPKLATLPSTVTTTTPETTMAAPITLTVAKPSTSAAATVSVVYQQGTNWLNVDNQGASIVLTPDARALLAGTYKATLQLQTSSPQQFASVPVTLTVSQALTTASDIAVTLSGQSIPADMQGALPVTTASGATLGSWTATSDVPWLKLDKSSGSAGESAAWHFDSTATTALQNFATHTAHITVGAGANVSSRQTTLQLTKQLPEISSIDQFALLTGVAGPVMVYGKGFSTLPNPAGNLQIAGAAASSVTVLSDRALTASMPALAAGDYNMTVINAVNLTTRSKKLSVLAPIDRSYQAIDTLGTKQILIWDPLTQSAYTMNRTLESVMRFDLSGTTLTVTGKNVSGLRTIGLPRDRSAVLAADAAGNLYDLSTADMSTLRTRALGVTPYDLYLSLPIPITGDNIAWLTAGTSYGATGLLAYDLDLNQAVAPPFATNVSPFFYYGPWAAVSPNGRRMLMTQSSSVSPGPPMLYWDTVEGKINQFADGAPAKFFYQVSTDRDGQRWVHEGYEVRGFDLGMLGQIKLPNNWYGSHSAVSRDGKRAYIYALNANAIGTYSEPTPITVWPRVYVFDITGPLVATTDFPLLGYIELSNYPACRATQGSDACSPYGVEFILTDDDRTLLAVGDRKFIVIPVPVQYRSP